MVDRVVCGRFVGLLVGAGGAGSGHRTLYFCCGSSPRRQCSAHLPAASRAMASPGQLEGLRLRHLKTPFPHASDKDANTVLKALRRKYTGPNGEPVGVCARGPPGLDLTHDPTDVQQVATWVDAPRGPGGAWQLHRCFPWNWRHWLAALPEETFRSVLRGHGVKKFGVRPIEGTIDPLPQMRGPVWDFYVVLDCVHARRAKNFKVPGEFDEQGNPRKYKDPTMTIAQRYAMDPEYRESMNQQGYTDETIATLDEMNEAIEASDDVKEEERAWVARMASGRETSAPGAQKGGWQKGSKGGTLRLGVRTDEAVARAGKWKHRRYQDPTPDPQARLMTEVQYQRGLRYSHHPMYQMPGEDEDSTEASEAEYCTDAEWSYGWASGWRRSSWQSWNWWS